MHASHGLLTCLAGNRRVLLYKERHEVFTLSCPDSAGRRIQKLMMLSYIVCAVFVMTSVRATELDVDTLEGVGNTFSSGFNSVTNTLGNWGSSIGIGLNSFGNSISSGLSMCGDQILLDQAAMSEVMTKMQALFNANGNPVQGTTPIVSKIEFDQSDFSFTDFSVGGVYVTAKTPNGVVRYPSNYRYKMQSPQTTAENLAQELIEKWNV
ncbi:uncharacterized protein LOC123538793 isoform X2 [Mercenaria mercenaria]|uniref:uncharacterized protein LOC123538793 isoform X2 n=1 Tax=Mercenaria mercenaria TaxID=6596 RepID=UPI00234F85A1|nr:uncharacterized protein LOC123538793 isoform X2 [Mercenaria mercenaria]